MWDSSRIGEQVHRNNMVMSLFPKHFTRTEINALSSDSHQERHHIFPVIVHFLRQSLCRLIQLESRIVVYPLVEAFSSCRSYVWNCICYWIILFYKLLNIPIPIVRLVLHCGFTIAKERIIPHPFHAHASWSWFCFTRIHTESLPHEPH